MDCLLIDNYDSFTYNIVHSLWEIGADVHVIANDALSCEQIATMQPRWIVIGPGPGNPKKAGISLECIAMAAEERIPLLGICLGMQAIGEAFGAKVTKARDPCHGKLSAVEHSGEGIFKGIVNGFNATRYHSLVVDESTLPDCLHVTAKTRQGEVMALKHAALPIEGVQFHPEAIATEHGTTLFKNWIHSLEV